MATSSLSAPKWSILHRSFSYHTCVKVVDHVLNTWWNLLLYVVKNRLNPIGTYMVTLTLKCKLSNFWNRTAIPHPLLHCPGRSLLCQICIQTLHIRTRWWPGSFDMCIWETILTTYVETLTYLTIIQGICFSYMDPADTGEIWLQSIVQ